MAGVGRSQFLTLPSEEVGIGSQFRKSIPDFASKVKELTSSSSFQFLPLLEGNSGIRNQCQKWIPHFRSIKWWIPELKWGIDKNVLLKVSINFLNFYQSILNLSLYFHILWQSDHVQLQTLKFSFLVCFLRLISKKLGILIKLYLKCQNYCKKFRI